tara:strand:+ start:6515 stop:6811 length:297 start_codon:yes stop_codon:yes gene_type:complete
MASKEEESAKNEEKFREIVRSTIHVNISLFKYVDPEIVSDSILETFLPFIKTIVDAELMIVQELKHLSEVYYNRNNWHKFAIISLCLEKLNKIDVITP